MTNEIKQRLEKLIGEGPNFNQTYFRESSADIVLPKKSDQIFNQWRLDLIERMASQAVVLIGGKYMDEWTFAEGVDPADTHTCLALDLQPIPKGVTKSEITKVLRGWAEPLYMTGDEMKALADRIEKFGVIDG